MGAEETIKLAYDTTQKAGAEVLQSVVGAGACVNLAVNLYGIGKDVKSYLFPSENEQAEAQNIDKQLKLMALRKEFRTCLIANRTSKARGWHGIPSPCQETAERLSYMGWQYEAIRMADIFNALNK